MQEAQNLIKLTNLETPLLGGENPDLAPGTGFEGIFISEFSHSEFSHIDPESSF
jgi:hypothetical protein